MIINDLITGVRGKLRGRTDLDNDIPFFIKDAIIDMSESYEFEELKVTGPLTAFIQGQNLYNFPFFVQTQDATKKITFIRTLFVYYANTLIQTANTTPTGFEMNNRERRVVEPMSVIPGIPTVYVQDGQNILVGYNPNQAYAVQMSYQVEHPFNPDNVLGSTQILMPNDWREIIVYAAAEKGCDNVGMNDVGAQYHSKLYGYKDKKGNETPGLIRVRESQQERNASFNSRQLRPVLRRYRT